MGARLAIIGGGFGALGVARAASERGFDVSLYVAGDTLLDGTSASSLRIVHGGLRYIQKLQVRRILRSIEAQARLQCELNELGFPLSSVYIAPKSGKKRLVENTVTFRLVASLYRWLLLLQGSAVKAPLVLSEVQALPYLFTGELGSTGQQNSDRHGSGNKLPGKQGGVGFQWSDFCLGSIQDLRQYFITDLQQREVDLHFARRVVAVEPSGPGYTLRLEGGGEVAYDAVVNAANCGNLSISTAHHNLFPEIGWALGWNLLFPLGDLCGPAREGYMGIAAKSFADGTMANDGLREIVARAFESLDAKHGRLFLVPRPREQVFALGTMYEFPSRAGEVVTGSDGAEIDRQRIQNTLRILPCWVAEALTVVHQRAIEFEAGYLPAEKKGSTMVLLDEDRFRFKGMYGELITSKFTTFQITGEALMKSMSERLER